MKITPREVRRRTARNRLIALATGTAVLTAAAVILLASHSASHTATAPPALPSAPEPLSSSATGASDAVPSVLLPKPDRVTEGVPTGYPHNERGAVSAAAHFADVLDVFDPQAAQRQAQIMADPAYSTIIGIETRRAGEQMRRDIGLAADGESSPEGYSTSQSRAFQDQTVAADRVVVWLLCDIEISVKGVVTDEEDVSGVVMIWTAGDWKLSIDQPTGAAPKSATPGSTQADREGWQSLAYAT